MGKQRIKTLYLQGQNGEAVTRDHFMVEKNLTVFPLCRVGCKTTVCVWMGLHLTRF